MSRTQIALPDGRALTAVVHGEGAPSVVLLSGFMAGSSEWSAVQRHLAPHVRTVSYDRAGYGDSTDRDGLAGTSAALADLLALLDGLKITDPAVFVAHSWGGVLLRLLARREPERVAALGLVDATRAEMLSPRSLRIQGGALRVMRALGPVGVPRLLLGGAVRGKLGGLTTDEAAAFLRDAASRRTLTAGLLENAAMAEDLALLADLEREGLPAVPVTYIVGERADPGGRKARAQMLAGHRDEAQQHPRGRLLLAAHSGHLVPQQQPDLVADEVLTLIGGLSRA